MLIAPSIALNTVKESTTAQPNQPAMVTLLLLPPVTFARIDFAIVPSIGIPSPQQPPCSQILCPP